MILVDTPVWSLSLRRQRSRLDAEQTQLVAELEAIIARREVALIGPVRQEILSGFAQASAWERLRDALRSYEDLPLSTFDFEEAARCFNLCRARGITGEDVDFLICAIAVRHSMPIFTLDSDFERYATVLPIGLHRVERI